MIEGKGNPPPKNDSVQPGISSKMEGLYQGWVDYTTQFLPVRDALFIIAWVSIFICFLAGWIESKYFPIFIAYSIFFTVGIALSYIIFRKKIRESRERIKRKKKKVKKPPFKESPYTVQKGDFLQ